MSISVNELTKLSLLRTRTAYLLLSLALTFLRRHTRTVNVHLNSMQFQIPFKQNLSKIFTLDLLIISIRDAILIMCSQKNSKDDEK